MAKTKRAYTRNFAIFYSVIPFIFDITFVCHSWYQTLEHINRTNSEEYKLIYLQPKETYVGALLIRLNIPLKFTYFETKCNLWKF